LEVQIIRRTKRFDSPRGTLGLRKTRIPDNRMSLAWISNRSRDRRGKARTGPNPGTSLRGEVRRQLNSDSTEIGDGLPAIRGPFYDSVSKLRKRSCVFSNSSAIPMP